MGILYWLYRAVIQLFKPSTIARMSNMNARTNSTSNDGVSSLDKVLLNFKTVQGKTFEWTLRQAVMGTQVFGATGSGKSSGSGKTIASAFLQNGFGGIVLCAKPGERVEWEQYARNSNPPRTNDLVIFSPHSQLCFDPLLYESMRGGEGSGLSINIIDLLMNIYEISRNFNAGGGNEDKFWENSMRRCISRSVDLLQIIGEPVTISNIRDIVLGACDSEVIEDYKNGLELLQQIPDDHEDKQNTKDFLEQCALNNKCVSLIHRGLNSMTLIDPDQFVFLLSYFFKEFSTLGEKTRATISEMVLGLFEPFLSGILQSHFSGRISNDLLPENTYLQNKIIILDFSVKEYLLSGVIAQSIYKYIWQQSMERRNIRQNAQPVFLWSDESQYFVNPRHDTLFQTTARSALVCSVYLTQNINNYYFMMGGGANASARAKSLIGNLGTKIFHANSDYDTNKFASDMIGQKERSKDSVSFGENSAVKTRNFVYDYQVRPYQFTLLKSGGASRVVTAIIAQNSPDWTGSNFLHVTFNQDIA